MTALVKYVDFHCDNYQGGSGKSFQFSHIIKLPDNLLVGDFWTFIHDEIKKHTEIARPFPGTKYAIQSVEVF
jgi:hypothetical protein